MSDVATRDRFAGCMFGLALGDALGAPYEGLNADNLYWGFGPSSDLVANPEGETLYYTDDAQMMNGAGAVLGPADAYPPARHRGSAIVRCGGGPGSA